MDVLFWPLLGLFILGILIILVATFKLPQTTVDAEEKDKPL